MTVQLGYILAIVYHSYRKCLQDCFWYMYRLKRILTDTIIWSRYTPSNDGYAS